MAKDDPTLVMIHVDDLGMSHAANRGGIEAMEGAATCGSIMVPCPGVEEMVAIALERGDLDFGCHITLNAEFPDYRWPPLLDDVATLSDENGFLFQTARETIAHADPAEVKREMRAQVSYLLDAGVKISHIDAHMGTATDQNFFDDYVQLADDFGLPVLLRRLPDGAGDLFNIEHGLRRDRQHFESVLDRMQARGNPVFERSIPGTPWYNPFVAAEHNRARLEQCRPGLNYLAVHSAYPTEELKDFAPDWMMRDAERYLYAAGGQIEAAVAELGFSTVNYPVLLGMIRAGQI